jgi:hypothetical protein
VSAATAPEGLPAFRFRARNVGAGENQAHTQEGARARGFRGSIVGGAHVFGQIVQPLVRLYGEEWLGRNRLEIQFKSPAYDGHLVTSRPEPDPAAQGPDAWVLRAFDEAETELAELRTRTPRELPAPDARASIPPLDWEGERLEGTYERFEIGKPFRSYRWCPTLEVQRAYCAEVGEELPIYTEGERPPVHPALVMEHGSLVVAHQLLLRFWIHARSEILTRRAIRVGDDVVLHCIPIDKWQRPRGDWVRFYQVYLVDGEPAVETWKTSVVRVAPRGHPEAEGG